MADAQDLKSCVPLGAYGFESRPGYLGFSDGGLAALVLKTAGKRTDWE